jgi:hypothetical protein
LRGLCVGYVCPPAKLKGSCPCPESAILVGCGGSLAKLAHESLAFSGGQGSRGANPLGTRLTVPKSVPRTIGDNNHIQTARYRHMSIQSMYLGLYSKILFSWFEIEIRDTFSKSDVAVLLIQSSVVAVMVKLSSSLLDDSSSVPGSYNCSLTNNYHRLSTRLADVPRIYTRPVQNFMKQLINMLDWTIAYFPPIQENSGLLLCCTWR